MSRRNRRNSIKLKHILPVFSLFFLDDSEEEANETKKERILNIIEHEFDLELLLKYREMRILEHELERGKDLKELLEKLILNGK